jgi:hypothetical protein
MEGKEKQEPVNTDARVRAWLDRSNEPKIGIRSGVLLPGGTRDALITKSILATPCHCGQVHRKEFVFYYNYQ